VPDESDLEAFNPFDLLDEECARIERFFSGGPDWARPSRCEGWTTRDMLSHLMGVEDYNRACLDGTVAALFDEARKADVADVDSFNAWTVDRYRVEPTPELLDRWRSANAAFRSEIRARGRHGTMDTSVGSYPSWRQAFHLAAEYATHADDIGVEVSESDHGRRTAWRVVFGRFVLAEYDRPVTVQSTEPGRLTLRVGPDEAALSDEEFVEATQARLPPDHPLSQTLRTALSTMP
jgi:uncharacterized protein (TIGR03083 family)